MARIGDRDALRAAARELSQVLRRTAGAWSDETAAAVNIHEGPVFEVRAGRPDGRWGWTPIQAYMLAANAAHPLYGNRKYWYRELRSGPAPFLDEAADGGAAAAMKAYADVQIPKLARAYGYK